MTSSEYQSWLASLTMEQRLAVETAVGVVMDALLMLEGRMSVTEAEIQRQAHEIAEQNKRITALEHIIGL